jgi:hypothetical protein
MHCNWRGERVAGMLHMVVHAGAIDNWDCCCMNSQLLHKQWLGTQGPQACHRKPLAASHLLLWIICRGPGKNREGEMQIKGVC